MKKRVVLIIVACILLILDNTLAPFIAVKGAWPSLLFIFSVSYSIINGKKEAVIIGVISGLLQDVFFYNMFGVNALINMFCCYLAGFIGEGIWRDRKLVPIITIFVGTILKYLGIFIIFYALNIHIDLFRGVSTALYNSIIMLFVYKTILRFFDREDMRKAWRF
ncbi:MULTISPECIES: rod shape-determining protein MreD [Clostridium]|uniref:Rod shape-determining protein MreD n=1 Tax=Clostridium cibarium TaxID=2762247 RepID=A0ABR8PR55_9CLOT|nr:MULTISPECIES: rod shape-determining protein MreD [Clostridium]MBD7910656.1 rod shape-determining protein MreD [Clostridium cibarium]